jgi:hypothetical protein
MGRSKRDELPRVETCLHCGGLHFGSNGCPYNETVCDVCHKTLLQHPPSYCFCDGGKTEHNPRQKYCTCEKCVDERREFSKRVIPLRGEHRDGD